MITNSPVTTKNIDLANRIVGPDVETIKVKTTRRKQIQWLMI